MKRWLLLCILSLVIGFAVFTLFIRVKQHIKKDLAQSLQYPTSVPTPTTILHLSTSATTRSLFVPYWSLKPENDLGSYQQYMFFGISADENGINTQDASYKNIGNFETAVRAGGKTILVLRMLDSDTNIAILKKIASQDTIIDQTIAIAKKQRFSGVVMDLEIQALPFNNLEEQITAFTAKFYSQLRRNDLTFGITVYGDSFFRLRPFDIKNLAHNADQLMVMAYDFSKSRSNPGPNFPLQGKETYGYDLTKMADDFLQYVPLEKLMVVFGMFGYDWKVDNQGNTVGLGEALTDNQIRQKFLDTCSFIDCSVRHDLRSSETEVTYTDSMGEKHIVWFEDMQSATIKQKYLQERGIDSFGYWANSYF